MVTAGPSDPPIEQLLRKLTPQVLGIVARRFRDFATAEDAVQEAVLAAAMPWARVANTSRFPSHDRSHSQ
jgi:predicted RNA polymerase sigma factor